MEAKTISDASNLCQNTDPAERSLTQNSLPNVTRYTETTECFNNSSRTSDSKLGLPNNCMKHQESIVSVPYHLSAHENDSDDTDSDYVANTEDAPDDELYNGDTESLTDSDYAVNAEDAPNDELYSGDTESLTTSDYEVNTFGGSTPVLELSPPKLIPISQTVEQFLSSDDSQGPGDQVLPPPVLTPLSPQMEKVPTSIFASQYDVINANLSSMKVKESVGESDGCTKSSLSTHSPISTVENACSGINQSFPKSKINVEKICKSTGMTGSPPITVSTDEYRFTNFKQSSTNCEGTDNYFGTAKSSRVVHDSRAFPEHKTISTYDATQSLSNSNINKYKRIMTTREQPLPSTVPVCTFDSDVTFRSHVGHETVQSVEIGEPNPKLTQTYNCIAANRYFTNFHANADRTTKTEISPFCLRNPTSPHRYDSIDVNHIFGMLDPNTAPTNGSLTEPVLVALYNRITSPELDNICYCYKSPLESESTLQKPSHPRTLSVNTKSAFKPVRVSMRFNTSVRTCHCKLLNRKVPTPNVYKHCLQSPDRHRSVKVLKVDTSKPTLCCREYLSATAPVRPQNLE